MNWSAFFRISEREIGVGPAPGAVVKAADETLDGDVGVNFAAVSWGETRDSVAGLASVGALGDVEEGVAFWRTEAKIDLLAVALDNVGDTRRVGSVDRRNESWAGVGRVTAVG